MAIVKTVRVTLEVREVPDFFPATDVAHLDVFKGAMAQYICSITPNSTFTGRVRLTTTFPASFFSVPTIGIGETSVLTVGTADIALGVFDIDISFEEVE
jgi:hypothetical protein